MVSSIPQHLAIEILYADESVVVISKPCNLRSVPGHAKPPPPSAGKRKRASSREGDGELLNKTELPKSSNRRTAQEAWAAAVQSIAAQGGSDFDGDDDDSIVSFICNLASISNLSSIPRKKKLFLSYTSRNLKRLLGNDKMDPEGVDAIANRAFDLIKEKQIPLLNLPEQTADEDSALGQLKLLGYGRASQSMPYNEKKGPNVIQKGQTDTRQLRVVHRLDCATSGVMVFARTDKAASSLCQAWRERKAVKKNYIAEVAHWPPFQDGRRESEGVIDLPLSPSDERLKWKVDRSGKGKPSLTLWSVRQRTDSDNLHPHKRVILELQPITGRTHQLRIHCAEVGSGIEGDSLYGDKPTEWVGNDRSANFKTSRSGTLHLHAHTLCFPHPDTDEPMQFTASLPSWAI